MDPDEQQLEDDAPPDTAAQSVPVPDFQLPAVEDQARGESLIWNRWKGSLQDIAQIFRIADELVEKAAGETQDTSYIGSVTVGLPGRERTFRKVEDFEAHLDELDVAGVETIRMSTGFWTDKVNVSVSFGGGMGAYLDVSGKDQFAVAGVERELKSHLNKGRRWTQVMGRWPEHVAFWAPWVAISGLALVDLIGGGVGRVIGLSIVAVSILMLLTALFMQYVEPKLIPPLELLRQSDERTVSQKWASRGVKLTAFAAAAVAGAVINGLTGFLF